MLSDTGNESLEFAWIKTWGGVGYYNDLFGTRRSDYGHEVAVDSNDNVYLVGETGSYGNGMSDFCLIKYNELGEQLWNRTWGGSRYDSAMDVAIDSNDNVYIAGSYHYYVAGEPEGGDMAVVKYNSSGHKIWERTFGGSNDDDCNAITIDLDDNIYLAGARDQGAHDDFLVAKYDSEGNLKWSQVFGGQYPDKCSDIAVDSSGNVYLVGDTNSFGTKGWFNFLIVKYNAYGSQLWYQAWGGSSDDHAYDVMIDSSNYIYVAGHSGDPDQITIVKFSSSGIYQWHRAWSSGSYFKDEWYDSGAIVLDKEDNIFITGSSKTLWVYNISGDLQWSLDYLSSGIGTCSGLAFDSHGNLYFAGKKTVIYSALCLTKYKIKTPKIEILTPIPNHLYGEIPPEYELSIYEPHLNSTWYSLNNGQNYTFSGFLGTIDRGVWDACGNGTVTIRFYANNSEHDISFEEVTVRKDNTEPEITILSPNDYDLFGKIPPEFEISIIEANLDTTWYSLNNGQNFTFSGLQGSINQVAWDSCENGTVSIKLWANDTVGNKVFQNLNVYKDVSGPLLYVIFPLNGGTFNESAPEFSLDIIESNLDDIWYVIDQVLTNFSCSLTGTIDQTIWTSLPDGPITLIFYANDSLGNVESVQILIRKDTIIPKIKIISPDQYQYFTGKTPEFIIDVDEVNLDSLWYTIDGRLTNISFTTNQSLNQEEWTAHEEGIVTITFYANDTFGRINSSSVIIIKDTIEPSIVLTSPTIYEAFGNEAPNFIIEIKDVNLDQMWYTLNGGLTNHTFTTNGSIDESDWTSHIDGNVLITFYARDFAGNEDYIQVIVEKDTSDPLITILAPMVNKFFSVPPFYNITITDLNLDSVWYTIDGGKTNISLSELSGALDQASWVSALDGQITIRFYANDTFTNENFAELIIFKDSISPIINIMAPASDQEFFDPPSYSIEINELNLESYWYTIDGGVHNHTLTELSDTVDQNAWNLVPSGLTTIRIYARDLAGNVGTSFVIVVKISEQQQPPPAIPGYDLYLLMGAISVISTIFIRKRLKT